MNKIFQEHSLDNPVFRLVASLKSSNKIFKKTTWKKFISNVGDSESISKILERHLQKNLHFRKVFCIYEQNLWNTPVKEYMDFHTAHMLWQEFIFGCEQIDPTGYHQQIQMCFDTVFAVWAPKKIWNNIFSIFLRTSFSTF